MVAGYPIYVDARSIVPRSLISEVLMDGTIDAWLSESTRSVLDLCTGNGSLAILAAIAYPEVQVIGADISKDALEVAAINVAKHALQNRIALIASDGMRAFSNSMQTFDLILCNPPYVNAASMASLPAEYLAEPTLALASGMDGMDFCRDLMQSISAHMTGHGILVLEIGNERAHFESAFPALEVVWLETSAGEDQVLLLTKAALIQCLST